jgi:hypothetical protein
MPSRREILGRPLAEAERLTCRIQVGQCETPEEVAGQRERLEGECDNPVLVRHLCRTSTGFAPKKKLDKRIPRV